MKKLVLVGSLGLIALAMFAGKRGLDNLNGVCRDAEYRRPLSDGEKYDKILSQLDQVEVGRIFEFIYHGPHAKIISGNYMIFTFGRPWSDEIKIYIFPNTPTKPVNFENYYEGVSWESVNAWYRATGYAYDLIFADMNILAVFLDGSSFNQHYEFRSWTDACGNFVPVPEEYEIG